MMLISKIIQIFSQKKKMNIDIYQEKLIEIKIIKIKKINNSKKGKNVNQFNIENNNQKNIKNVNYKYVNISYLNNFKSDKTDISDLKDSSINKTVFCKIYENIYKKAKEEITS